MATNRRQRVQPRRLDATAERIRYRLETGHDFGLLDGPELDDEELFEAWQELRESILPDYIRANPGRRPWGFWQFEAGDRLAIEDGPLDRERVLKNPELYAEVPVGYRRESETEYLIRRGLLSDGERVALAARGF